VKHDVKCEKFKQNKKELIKMAENDDNKDDLVEMICRQTCYDREEATLKLAEAGGNPVKVIEAYLGVQIKKDARKKPQNTHQMIFQEINKFVEETSQQPLRKN
jgi:hypothetical protein